MVFKCQRWTLANILPVAFVLWVISTIWLLYLWLHLHPLLQIGVSEEERDEAAYRKGLFQTVFSQTCTAMLLICFSRAICTDPGSVPETPEWAADSRAPKLKWPATSSSSQPETDRVLPEQHEVKQTGARRFCKWCNSYKPDRCHHCRVCKSCILRMDHHCPWIANCVGFRNHKYFFLLVFYSLVTTLFISITMSESLNRALVFQTTSMHRFLLVFGMTLSVIMGFLLVMFFALHIWLMLNATTTIEFCEKRTRGGMNRAFTSPSFDRGCYENVKNVLGPMPIFWLVPCMPPTGTGMKFLVQHTNHDEGASEGSERGPDEATPLLPDKERGHENSDKIKSADLPVADTTPPEVTGKGAATV